VYPWVDGIHLKVRLDQENLCLLVMLGVRAEGRKELVAITDGYRESTESWADLLRDCERRRMTAPEMTNIGVTLCRSDSVIAHLTTPSQTARAALTQHVGLTERSAIT
jgi:Transposase, Mutator family